MSSKHLTEEQVQLYALEQEKQLQEHIQQCKDCRARVKAYQLLFTGVREQEAPSFDFDLSSAVMAKLPVARPRLLSENYLIYLPVSALILVMAILSYFFRHYLASLLSGVSMLAIYLATVTVLGLLAILCIDMYRNYTNKIKSLDFY